MTRSTSLIFAILCGAMLAGCVAVNSTQLGVAQLRPPVPVDQVAVYRTADQVPGKYQEVALLNATGSSSMTTEKGMFEKMKKEAGKLGANGIILDALSEPGAGAKVAAAFLGVGVNRKGRAIAIYYRASSSSTSDSTTSK